MSFFQDNTIENIFEKISLNFQKRRLKMWRSKMWIRTKIFPDKIVLNARDYKYSTFLSNIEAHIEKTGKYVRCPGCRKGIAVQTLTENWKRVGEESRAIFEPTCPHCGLDSITIFND